MAVQTKRNRVEKDDESTISVSDWFTCVCVGEEREREKKKRYNSRQSEMNDASGRLSRSSVSRMHFMLLQKYSLFQKGHSCLCVCVSSPPFPGQLFIGMCKNCGAECVRVPSFIVSVFSFSGCLSHRFDIAFTTQFTLSVWFCVLVFLFRLNRRWCSFSHFVRIVIRVVEWRAHTAHSSSKEIRLYRLPFGYELRWEYARSNDIMRRRRRQQQRRPVAVPHLPLEYIFNSFRFSISEEKVFCSFDFESHQQGSWDCGWKTIEKKSKRIPNAIRLLIDFFLVRLPLRPFLLGFSLKTQKWFRVFAWMKRFARNSVAHTRDNFLGSLNRFLALANYASSPTYR